MVYLFSLMHFGPVYLEEMYCCFLYSIDLKTNNMKLRFAQNPLPHQFIFLPGLWIAILDFKLYAWSCFIFCYFKFSIVAKVITFSAVTLDLGPERGVCVSFPGIAMALKRQLCFDQKQRELAGPLGVSSSVASGASLPFASLVLPPLTFLSPLVAYLGDCATFSSRGRWLGRHERQEGTEKEDKPSALPSLQSLLAWLASQPPTWPSFGNGVLTILFEVYHSIMKNSLLNLAFPLVGSPYVRGSHGCCSPAKSCLTLCDPMNCSLLGPSVVHCLPDFVQIHVHWIGDAVSPSHALLLPSHFALQSFPVSGSF